MSPRNLSLLRTFAPLLGIAVLAVVMLVVAPAVLSPFRLNSLGKYTCWAIAAVGIDNITPRAIRDHLKHQKMN